MHIQKVKYSLLLLLILLGQLVVSAQVLSDDDRPVRILFIGNSYSYHNSLSQIVYGLAKEKFTNREIETKMISDGGITLKGHWKDTKALEEIRRGHWDYVILQEQSILGSGVVIDGKRYFNKPDTFYEYARKFDAEIKKAGAQTVFFMTWSAKNSPQQQKYLTHAYMTMAMELDALIAPVGLVWDEERDNEIFDLYKRDGSHPSAYGSYLAATTLFTTIFKTDPTGISGNIDGYRLSSNGQRSKMKQNLVNLSNQEAASIQASTLRVVNSLRKTQGYLKTSKPEKDYSIPTLPNGNSIDRNALAGKWYGTMQYSNSYVGLIIDIDNSNPRLKAEVSFYDPEHSLELKAENLKLELNTLSFHIVDGAIDTEVNFVITDKGLFGISKRTIGFYGRLTIYDNWILSRDKFQNNIDLAALAEMTEAYKKRIIKDGYIKSTIEHYSQYAKLIGRAYKPSERDLNVKGYRLLGQDHLEQALNVFELNTILYPESANAFDSFGEALVKFGSKHKALTMFEKAYNIAKSTNNQNTAYFEKNMTNLKMELK